MIETALTRDLNQTDLVLKQQIELNRDSQRLLEEQLSVLRNKEHELLQQHASCPVRWGVCPICNEFHQGGRD